MTDDRLPDRFMTWGEFKREVERHHVTDDTPIRRIELYKPRPGENFVLGTPLNADGEIDLDG